MKKSAWFIVLVMAALVHAAAEEIVVRKRFGGEIAAQRPALLAATVNTPDLKLRKQPNLRAEILSSLKKGERIMIGYRTFAEQDISGRRGYWYYVVDSSSRPGWVFGPFLDFNKTRIEAVPIVYDAELFVRPKGRAVCIDPEKPPRPLMNGPGMVISPTPLFKDERGREKLRDLPLYAGIEYAPFFISDLNPARLVRIRVTDSGEEGWIDLQSGADFPVSMVIPDLEDSFELPAFSKPDPAARTDETIGFDAPYPNETIGLSADAAGRPWLQVIEGGSRDSFWIPAAHQRFSWRDTMAKRVLTGLANVTWPVSDSGAIAAFGQPAARYVQTVDLRMGGGTARLHHLFFDGLYLLFVESSTDNGWWLVEWHLWDDACRLNFGFKLNQALDTLKPVMDDQGNIAVGWHTISETGDGWIHLYFSADQKLRAIQHTQDLEMHWYFKAVFLDGFHETKVPLSFGYLDEAQGKNYIVKFGGDD